MEADSAAAMMSAELNGPKYCNQNSQLMFHQAKVAWDGYMNQQEAAQLAKDLRDTNLALERRLAPRLHMTVKEYHNKTNGKDWYLDCDEMVRRKIAYRAEIHCDNSLLTGPYAGICLAL